MPATFPGDDARDDWSRTRPLRDPTGYDEGPVDEPTGQVPAVTGHGDDAAPQEPIAPPDRAPLPVAGLTALLTVALALGAVVGPGPYAILVFVVQALFVLAWVATSRPPAPRITTGVGLAAAAAADLAALSADPVSLAPLAYVTAAAFVAGVVGELARPAGRERVTESLGCTMAAVVGVIALASLVVLSRHPLGTPSIVVCVVAAGVAVMGARLTDSVTPLPRLAPQVPRGGAGVLLGVLAGAVVAAVAGALAGGLASGPAAAAGLATALIAVVVDLAVCYAEVGRQLAGQPPAPTPARRALGPLLAFALVAPVAYAASALVLWDRV
ncbi:hypothetical protein [Planosporangium mesophilum]|uniref:Uncharacterized protein n=1 Tax=Planosporangium mesophilum TaxID=689768 RepID=A0A8J3WZ91_9ACTN|nr:hypothetical protein [Planosporangium mesophilum]NJC80977.1 hypothetical protein [Planosporangium mesophilum]GII21381.1 hypothetical protein Pme01_09780 [Planosporangium mesophilum]